MEVNVNSRAPSTAVHSFNETGLRDTEDTPTTAPAGNTLLRQAGGDPARRPLRRPASAALRKGDIKEKPRVRRHRAPRSSEEGERPLLESRN